MKDQNKKKGGGGGGEESSAPFIKQQLLSASVLTPEPNPIFDFVAFVLLINGS